MINHFLEAEHQTGIDDWTALELYPDGSYRIFVAADAPKPIPRAFTLPKTNIAPENRPGPKRKLVFQASIFRCYVSFKEGMICFNLFVIVKSES